MIAITNVASVATPEIVTADRDGRFDATLPPGEYALAITTDQGYAYVDWRQLPDLDATLAVTRTCRPVHGRVKNARAGTRVHMSRYSPFDGDEFVANVRGDGTFVVCLPEAGYMVELQGATLSQHLTFTLDSLGSGPAMLDIEGFARADIERPPGEVAHVQATLDGLVADILQRDARVIGLGEATHGTLELTTSRAAFTFELIRRADLRLVMFEFDAILATAIDDYVMGRDVDLAKAVAALGFWITDTHELLAFFDDLRTHNKKARYKVRVGGFDAQDTKPPVDLLLANARTLKLTPADKAMLEPLADKRGRAVLDFAPARRTALDALLARLSNPRSESDAHVRIALAARSLAIQLGYLAPGNLDRNSSRRDAGMAAIASFAASRTSAGRAAVWAHSAHVARETHGAGPAMGKHLALVSSHRYYPVGIYVYEGSVRAWDAAGKIGVISHPMPRAADYTLEGAVMATTRTSDIAWLPIAAFPPALRAWATVPRYTREVGALFYDEAEMMTLRDVPAAFDAVAVIKTGHDSSPTPTGIRKVDR